MKKLLVLTLLTTISLSMAACEQKENNETVILRQELQELKREKEEAKLAQELLEKEQKEAADLEEKVELQKQIDSLNKKIEDTEKKKAATPPAPKFGPGNMNGPNNSQTGYVKVVTQSANGKLTLRQSFAQSSAPVKDLYTNKAVLIPNGTSGIYYTDLVKNGAHTWYYAEYNGNYGWLRGDYLRG